MPRIKLEDLPVLEDLDATELKGIFGGEPIETRLAPGGDLYRPPRASSRHDFGDIERGKTVTVEFKFQNTGDLSLEKVDVSPHCGCTPAPPDLTQ